MAVNLIFSASFTIIRSIQKLHHAPEEEGSIKGLQFVSEG